MNACAGRHPLVLENRATLFQLEFVPIRNLQIVRGGALACVGVLVVVDTVDLTGMIMNYTCARNTATVVPEPSASTSRAPFSVFIHGSHFSPTCCFFIKSTIVVEKASPRRTKNLPQPR